MLFGVVLDFDLSKSILVDVACFDVGKIGV